MIKSCVKKPYHIDVKKLYTILFPRGIMDKKKSIARIFVKYEK